MQGTEEYNEAMRVHLSKKPSRFERAKGPRPLVRSSMSALVFVDTSVLAYTHQASETIKQPLATQWIEKLWREQRGRTSTQVLGEYYETLTRKIVPAVAEKEAWAYVRTLFAWEPQAIDAGILLRAREIEQRYRLSWSDCLVVASAQAQGCTLLLSENLPDKSVFGVVTVRNPFTLSVHDETSEMYEASNVVSRH